MGLAGVWRQRLFRTHFLCRDVVGFQNFTLFQQQYGCFKYKSNKCHYVHILWGFAENNAWNFWSNYRWTSCPCTLPFLKPVPVSQARFCLIFVLIRWFRQKWFKTRMHSSRMRTTRFNGHLYGGCLVKGACVSKTCEGVYTPCPIACWDTLPLPHCMGYTPRCPIACWDPPPEWITVSHFNDYTAWF